MESLRLEETTKAIQSNHQLCLALWADNSELIIYCRLLQLFIINVPLNIPVEHESTRMQFILFFKQLLRETQLNISQDDPEKTKATVRGDFYVTGDRGLMDDNGYFWFVGRADDVINSAG